jgi:hypothetical protein
MFWRKAKLRKVDEIVGELSEGADYLVPTLVGSLSGKGPMQEYPVLGTRHYDVDHFNVHMPHYHIDLRFYDHSLWIREGKQVLVGAGRREDGSLPPIIYKKMRCRQSCVLMNITQPDGRTDFWEVWRGAQCGGSAKEGWICPHKGTFLGSQFTDIDGVITCPAHSLRIDAKTGKVL